MKTKAQNRLDNLRKHASEINTKHWKGEERYTWRNFVCARRAGALHDVAVAHYGSPSAGAWKKTRYGLAFNSFEFPFLEYEPENRYRIQDTLGYYLSDLREETIIPVVLTYHGRDVKGKKEKVLIPGYKYSDCDGVTCFPFEHYALDDESGALKRAHSIAESIAEDSREYQERENAVICKEEKITEARDTIKEARARFHSLAVDLKSSGKLAGTICDTVRAAMQKEREKVRENVRALPGLLKELTEARESFNYFLKTEGAQ